MLIVWKIHLYAQNIKLYSAVKTTGQTHYSSLMLCKKNFKQGVYYKLYGISVCVVADVHED